MMHDMEEIALATGGEFLQKISVGRISRLLLDSRKIIQPAESLFIAIAGPRHDGHHFLEDVYAGGVRNFIVEKTIDPLKLPEANIIRVSSATKALQSIAAAHRQLFHYPVIGITGSNGKTIVKEWLNTLMADEYNIVRSPKSYNSQVGVPLSVWNMEASHNLGIFEAGISMPGEMENLRKVVVPDIGVFTSIGTAHSENFLSRRQLIGEKLNLFSKTNVLVLPEDADLMQLVIPWLNDREICFVPSAENATLLSHNGNTSVQIKWREESYKFDIPFIDKASVENTMTCIYTMLLMAYSGEVIQQRLSRLTALEMRLQLLNGENDCVLVNDAYSNDLQSLEIALDFLCQHARFKEKTVILSDVFQSGLNETELHSRISTLLHSRKIEKFIGVGKSMMRHQQAYPDGSIFFESTDDFLLKKNGDDFIRQAILIKGARDFRFERIVSMLQEKTHDTILEIDLGAMAHNLNYFKSKLLPQTKLMVMVKAFGYGIGSGEVASLLEFNKVDYLAVAYTDEGVSLRKAGVSLPVMVMNPEKSSLTTLVRHKLEPEIYSFRTLENFIKALHNTDTILPYPIHIKLDTGMHRLGFEVQDMERLGAIIASRPDIRVATMFTHLAATDDVKHDEFTHTQLTRLRNMTSELRSTIKQKFLVHALNTGGIERFPNAQFDMVRLGIGLYGVSASGEEQKFLRQVSQLKTVISQIRNIPKGDSVGYSRNFIADKDMKIATIPVGYADGLRRSMSNGNGHVIISGQIAPIVGNVCMDMTMVDITNIDCHEGDEVEIFGQHITLNQFASMCKTIPYEILTAVSQRVKRVYLQD
jgi:Alr-MurF fusion protein